MDLEINFIGRYGEHFACVHNEEDTYIVSCDEIDMKNVSMNKQEFVYLYDKYYRSGDLSFDKSDKNKILSRARNLGEELHSNFWFFKRNNGTYEKLVSAIKVYEILNDVKVLELSEDDYLNHFIKFRNGVDEEYIQFILNLQKRIINKERSR